MLRIEFKRDQFPFLPEGSGHTDCAVAAQGPDLQDSTRTLELNEHVEQRALQWADVDCGKPRCSVCLENLCEDGVIWKQGLRQKLVDARVGWFIHGGSFLSLGAFRRVLQLSQNIPAG